MKLASIRDESGVFNGALLDHCEPLGASKER